MKKIALSITLISASIVFGQKKEIVNAVKAVDSGDHSTATSEVAKAEAIIGDKTYLLEPSLQEQLYYAKGLALLKSGKNAEGAVYLAKINDLGKEKIFTGKNNDKNKVYFVGKQQADQLGNGLSLKEEKYTPSLIVKLNAAIQPLTQASSLQATNDYNTKKYDSSAEKFKETYYLLKAIGQDNKIYLYYAGLSYAQSDKKTGALEIFNDLINSNYTGIETIYTAKNKKTGETENLDKNAYDLYSKMKDASEFSDFKIEKTPSKEEELYEIQSVLLMDLEKYDDAIAVADKGIKKFPNNSKLAQTQSLAYYKAGKTDQFVATLQALLAKNPNDATNWYNLGVIYSKDASKQKEAEDAFGKALQLDPNNKLALVNMIYFQMGDDSKTVDSYNALRKAGKIDEANKVMEKRRARFTKALPYAEKLYALDPKDVDNVTLLKSFYMSTQNTAKYNEFKAIEAELKK